MTSEAPPSPHDAELLERFSSAPTAKERAEALRVMYAEKRIGPLKASPAFRAGVDWLGGVLTGDDEAERVIALATLERIRTLTNELEQAVDRLTAAGLSEAISSLEACDSAEDRARVATVIGRHRPAWAVPMLAQTAVLEPVGGKVSKVRVAAMESLVAAVDTFEDALSALASQFPAGGEVAGVARRLEFLLRDARGVLGARRGPLGGAPGKALAKLAGVVAPKTKGGTKFEPLRAAAEEVVLLMHELVQSRLSYVVDPAAYAALTPIRDWMYTIAPTTWAEFARSSPGLSLLRDDLAEAIVIRALAGIPDDTLYQRLQAACESREAAREVGKKLAAREGLSPPLQRWLQQGEANFASDPHEELRAEGDIVRLAQLLQDSQRLEFAAFRVRDTVLPEIELVAPQLMPTLRSEQNLVHALLEGTRAMAAGRGLRLHGTPGETMAFLPSHHRVVGGMTSGFTRVSIVTPAVEEARSDGTTRVVVLAIVEVVKVPT